MQETLREFFRAHGQQPWKPGEVDCCLFLASWALWLGHPDPAPHLRGTYDCDDGFRAIIRAAGGVVPVVERCAGLIRAKRLQQPVCGAIGVIGSQANIDHQYGAIFDGMRWNVRFIHSIGPMTAAPLAIWSI
ncbi:MULTISPECIES: DUF6950 family protein [unclassified Rhizobium]|uniref:DUF6950 family protein n=1 Tax=unclassified Rhizobium TaxID=2613769 RepID=UPI00288BDF49|nr:MULTISPECIES: hypothetical protein [unclassified Rhizobium]